MSYEYSILDIKKDQIFCEFDGGSLAIRFMAIEDGHLDKDGNHLIKGKHIGSNNIQNFSANKDYLHYGPELYIGDYSIPYSNVKYLN